MRRYLFLNTLALIGGTLSTNVLSQDDLSKNPFELRHIQPDNLLAQDSTKKVEGSCGEGMCGSGMGKMGEGACGNMIMDMDGMVMGENKNNLPGNCQKISKDISISVYVGTKYANDKLGTVYGFDKHEWSVPGCSRVTVTFTNEDQVRHQWMVHYLPTNLYPNGMFHLEANGGASKTGTFIVPNNKANYLVHCDMAQHMEKGLKAQLKVAGGGVSNLLSIPGLSPVRYPDPEINDPDRYK